MNVDTIPINGTHARVESARVPHEWSHRLKQQLLVDATSQGLAGESPSAQQLKEELLLVAASDATVLVSGETGTGKSYCAHLIHYISKRAGAPFIPVSCGAVPDELFENMLFGHERGSYTDAQSCSHGLIKEAEGGTLLLDDVECLTPRTQAKVLRFLDTHKYLPLGATRELTGNVRIISTANEDLESEVRNKGFRADLFYRLSVLEVQLIPLRERPDDILPLAHFFAREYATHYAQRPCTFSPASCARLTAHTWPGNIRELQNVLHRAVLHAENGVIEQVHIGHAAQQHQPHTSPGLHRSMRESKREMIEAFEKAYLSDVMRECKGNISAAARRAGKNRRAFWELLRKYDLTTNDRFLSAT